MVAEHGIGKKPIKQVSVLDKTECYILKHILFAMDFNWNFVIGAKNSKRTKLTLMMRRKVRLPPVIDFICISLKISPSSCTSWKQLMTQEESAMQTVMTAVIELIWVGVRCPRNHRTFSDQSFHRSLLFHFYTPPYHHHIQQ